MLLLSSNTNRSYMVTSVLAFHNTIKLNQPRGVSSADNVAQKTESPPLSLVQTQDYRPSRREINRSLLKNVGTPTDYDLKRQITYRLNNSGFRQMDNIEKEKLIGRLLESFNNVYQFYYLLENYINDISLDQFLYSIKCIDLWFLENKTNALENADSTVLPVNIQVIIDKYLLKNSIHIGELDCYKLFLRLNGLKQNLTNYPIQIMMQLLKYHVNNLELTALLHIKVVLDELETRYNNSFINTIDKNKKDFIKYLVQNLDLAVRRGVELKLNEIHTLKTPFRAAAILEYYTNALSAYNYEHVLTYLFLNWKNIRLKERLIVTESMVKRGFKSKQYLDMVVAYINKKFYEAYDNKKFPIKMVCPELYGFKYIYQYRFLCALDDLQYYDAKAIELLIKLCLEAICNNVSYLEKNYHLSKHHVTIVNRLLSSSIKFETHRNVDLIEYFMKTFMKAEELNDSETTNASKSNGYVTNYENSFLNYYDFLYYAAICNYTKYLHVYIRLKNGCFIFFLNFIFKYYKRTNRKLC